MIAPVHPSWLEVIVDPVRFALLRMLSEVDEASAVELIERGSASEPAVRRHLDALVTLGLVRERLGSSDGRTRGRPAAWFSLDSKAKQQAYALFEVLSEPLEPWPRRTPAPDPLR